MSSFTLLIPFLLLSMKNIIFLYLAIAAFSCSNVKESIEKLNPVKTLKFTGVLKLPLDENSIQNTSNLQFFAQADKSHLAFYNKPDNSIKVYSLDKQVLTQSIQLYTDGPNAIIDLSGSPENFKIISIDSIYIYSTVQEKIFRINSKGEIQDSWDAPLSSLGPKYPPANLNTLCSIIPFKDKFVLTSQLSWHPDGQPPLSIISSTFDQSIQREPKKSIIYQQYNVSEIGNWNFFKASNTMTNDSVILISYPLDHKVLAMDTKLNVQYHELNNPKLGSLKGFGEKLTSQNANSQEYFDFQGTAPVYHAIIADPYNQLIYRIARMPFSMEEVRKIRNGGELKSWDFSVMIYNNDFEFVGEKTLVNTIDYNMNSIFLSPNGLHIQRKSKDEDIMLFDIFQISRYEN